MNELPTRHDSTLLLKGIPDELLLMFDSAHQNINMWNIYNQLMELLHPIQHPERDPGLTKSRLVCKVETNSAILKGECVI